ncbi:MAG: hypothetical protein ACRYGG_06140 [Janthinobacterium lividum]
MKNVDNSESIQKIISSLKKKTRPLKEYDDLSDECEEEEDDGEYDNEDNDSIDDEDERFKVDLDLIPLITDIDKYVKKSTSPMDLLVTNKDKIPNKGGSIFKYHEIDINRNETIIAIIYEYIKINSRVGDFIKMTMTPEIKHLLFVNLHIPHVAFILKNTVYKY